MYYGPKELKNIRNMGDKTYDEIMAVMQKLGYIVTENTYGVPEFLYSNVDCYNEPELDLFKQWEISKNDLTMQFKKSYRKLLLAKGKADEYNGAYQFYLESEDIFNPNAIVPAMKRIEEVKKQDEEPSVDYSIDIEPDRSLSTVQKNNSTTEERLDTNTVLQQRREMLLKSIREKQDELEQLLVQLAELDDNTYDENEIE